MGSYLHPDFVSRIDKKSIKTIFECGSRDCLDAIELKEYFNPDVIYSFECNPESIEVCRKNINGFDIKLIEKAVCNKNGIFNFYATDMEKSVDKNIGASSLLWHRDNKVEFFQKKIQVEGIRLDSFMQQFNVDSIDLLCMDIQGSEYLAIEGLGERLKDVRYIITEVSKKNYYVGDMLKKDMKKLLNNKGFYNIHYMSGNMLFRRNNSLLKR